MSDFADLHQKFLELQCPVCDGEGRFIPLDQKEKVVCHLCEGTGFKNGVHIYGLRIMVDGLHGQLRMRNQHGPITK